MLIRLFEALYNCVMFGRVHPALRRCDYCTLGEHKETKLERADFTLQLLMFVTAEKERVMFIIFLLSIFCQLLSRGFKQGQAERVQTREAQTNLPRRQLFLM